MLKDKTNFLDRGMRLSLGLTFAPGDRPLDDLRHRLVGFWVRYFGRLTVA